MAEVKDDWERAEKRVLTSEVWVVYLKRRLVLFKWTPCLIFRKILELKEELKVVGNNVKSLEVAEEKVNLIEK